jgi:hypothetical protein
VTRNLDPTLAAGLSAGLIYPVVLVQLTFNSGLEHVWSGIGDLVWNGATYKGVGDLGSIGPIGEGSAVKADGTTVTLSGIGQSQIDVPGGGPTPPLPPFTPPTGQSVAWSYATIPPSPSLFSNPPNIFNDFLGCSGSASGGLTSGSLGVTNGQSVWGGILGDEPIVGLTWAGFKIPPEVPLGARIAGVYPVFTISSVNAGGIICGSYAVSPPVAGTTYGSNIGTLPGSFSASILNTLEGAASLLMDITFVGIAIYYEGTPQSKASLLYEALGDIRPGGPAKIWFGLMSAGTFMGAPYLVFKGQVDKPTLKASAETLSITLALENRLVNLQRPNARRYTAADQRLYFPTDSAFNFVEILNDMALVWG